MYRDKKTYDWRMKELEDRRTRQTNTAGNKL